MTREEFTHGWIFLTTQPWGAIYDGRLEPDKARIQFELYYERLSYAHPQAWLRTAKLFAAGAQWPALDAIRQSLSQCNQSFRPALPTPQPTSDLTTEEQADCEATLSRLIGKPFRI